MSDPTPEQIAKLPKWAQDHIRGLQSALHDSQSVVGSLTAPVTDETELHYRVAGTNQRCALPDGSTVIFRIGNQEVWVSIRDTRVGPSLNIMAATGALQVSPEASNSVFLTFLP